MPIMDFKESCSRQDARSDTDLKDYLVHTVPIRLTQTPTICRVPLPIVRRDILHVAGVCLNRIGTVHTRAISELSDLNSPTVLAIGLKGVGKSAAFRSLTEFETETDVVIGINVDSYTLHLPRTDLHYATCAKQFKHDIVIEALRGIVAKKETIGRKITRALMREASGHVNSYRELVSQFAGRFGGVSVLGCGFTLNQGNAAVLIGLRPDSDVNAALNTLQKICKKNLKIRIVVDDPEQVFSASRQLDTHLAAR